MKSIRLLIFFSAIIISFSRCNSILVPKAPPAAEEGVDSVLFYEQADLPDPLIDAVLAPNDSEIHLSAKLTPPPPLAAKFKQIEGFRIQIFAGVDETIAEEQRRQARGQVKDSVYLVPEQGLFKVHVGDYPYRIDADQARQKMRELGYSGAWVVKTTINEPLDSAAAEPQQVEIAPPRQNGRITIQVLALSNRQDAEMMARELETNFQLPSKVKETAGLFKVFLGNFADREEAQQALQRIRNNGYPDAWLVY